MSEDLPEIQRSVATKILAHAQAKEKSFSFDPFTIMAICNCIISIVKLLYMCYSKESMYSAITKKDKGVFQNFLLKREIRKHFRNKDDRKAIYGAVIEVSSGLSKEDINTLLED